MTRQSDEVADDLRRQVTSGQLQPGDTLPTMRGAQDQYGVSASIIRSAYRQLQAEGLVHPTRGRGTVVIGAGAARISRSRRVYRDHLGYYFDREAQPFRPIGKPQVNKDASATYDIAHRLRLDTGALVVIRDRVMGLPGSRRKRPTPLQVATSYLPGWLAAEVPVIAEGNTGPGGIYDRIEEWAEGPLTWEESVTAALADRDDAHRLRLPIGAALLRIVRTALLPDGRPCEINDTRMDAARFEIPHKVSRSTSAAWPVNAAADTPQAAEHDEQHSEAVADTRGGEPRD